MKVNFGVDNKEELLSYGIEIRTLVVPASEYTPLANPRYVATKAWDNRVGCAIGAEVLKNISKENFDGDIYFAGTVQEEVGIRGAKTSSYKIRPDFAISIDIGGYGDTPGCKSYDSTLKLGKGPGIMFLDAACIGHECEILKKNSYQILKNNSVITVETGIYIEGFGGVRIEDTIVVTNDGPIVLTKSTKELIKV